MTRALAWFLALGFCAAGTLGQYAETPQDAPLEGRLFNRSEDAPVAGAHVFALGIGKKKEVLAHTVTSAEKGPEKGRWQLNGLPLEGEIVLVAFHEETKGAIWLHKYALTGRYNDLSLVYSTVPALAIKTDPKVKAIWPHLNRLGWVKNKVTDKNADAGARELADALLATLPKPKPVD